MSTGSRSQDTPVLDIGGPLLPHHLLNITALTPVAIGGSAIISHSTHNPTVPFNMNAVTASDVALPMQMTVNIGCALYTAQFAISCWK